GALVARPAPRLAGERPAQLARSWWLAAAASVLFVAALSLWFARRAAPVPLRELAERTAPRYVEANLRGNEEPEYVPFPKAMMRYTAGDYAGAADALARLLEDEPEHGPARFYLAAAREQLGELDAAQSDYRRVADEQPGLLGEHARWRLA